MKKTVLVLATFFVFLGISQLHAQQKAEVNPNLGEHTLTIKGLDQAKVDALQELTGKNGQRAILTQVTPDFRNGTVTVKAADSNWTREDLENYIKGWLPRKVKTVSPTQNSDIRH